jgi:glycosyltransferase involved in cell wall biosynthesis
MKLLLCHAHYQQRGGEDHSFEDEARLLESRGHEVVRYTLHNDAINEMGQLGIALRTVWHHRVFRELREIMASCGPDLVHFTNTFPLISPAAYYAAVAEGVPVVQSLRNYRLLCPNALFLRDGLPCEDCLGRRVAMPAIKHKCYRESRAATAVVAGMLTTHRLMGTWTRRVGLYVTPSEFARRKFIAGGFPEDRIAVKPNFVDPDPGEGSGSGGYAIFVGRLSSEKGISTLLDAWTRHAPPVPLKIVGDGPMAPQVQAAVDQSGGKIEWLGRRPNAETMQLIGEAAMLVFPSLAYETFGRSVIESFAKGTPVITSDQGASAELVDTGVTGHTFPRGDAQALARRVSMMAGQSRAMRPAARAEYLRHYTPDHNYRALMAVYHRVLVRRVAEVTLGGRVKAV